MIIVNFTDFLFAEMDCVVKLGSFAKFSGYLFVNRITVRYI